ncbi:MAG: hypothetical protein NVS9B4_14880 [Candidatus Acidiferrum sp.]
MKGLWGIRVGAWVMAIGAMMGVQGCNDYGNTFQASTGPGISSLSPSNVSAGSASFTITVTGAGFVKQTIVKWNGTPLQTQITTNSAGSVTLVTATVPADLVAKAGSATIVAVNPPTSSTDNGLSNPITFIINPAPNPLPALTSITPACVTLGSAEFAMTLVGTNFLAGSQVNWSASGTQTTLVTTGTPTSSQIQATVPAALVANVGSALVTVFNPAAPAPGGGGGSSNARTFTIKTASQTCPTPSSASTTTKDAVTVQGGAGLATETPAVSSDGRYVVYVAAQTGGVTGERSQIFQRDTCSGRETAGASCEPKTTLISAALDGSFGDGDSASPSASADGRYVAFSSDATNLVANFAATGARGRQIYLRDTCAGASEGCTPSTQLISVDTGGLAGAENVLPSISGSGRFVAFLVAMPSHGSSGGSGTSSGDRQVFVRDTCLGVADCTPKTTRISLQPGDSASGAVSAITPSGPAMSGKGDKVAIAEARTATLFTPAVRIDDRVFLAITNTSN